MITILYIVSKIKYDYELCYVRWQHLLPKTDKNMTTNYKMIATDTIYFNLRFKLLLNSFPGMVLWVEPTKRSPILFTTILVQQGLQNRRRLSQEESSGFIARPIFDRYRFAHCKHLNLIILVFKHPHHHSEDVTNQTATGVCYISTSILLLLPICRRYHHHYVQHQARNLLDFVPRSGFGPTGEESKC